MPALVDYCRAVFIQLDIETRIVTIRVFARIDLAVNELLCI
jgi:hypothetical protein